MLRNIDHKSKFNGTFEVAHDKKVAGTLSLDGLQSSLHLWDEEDFEVNSVVQGKLNDLRLVSLFDCIIRLSPRIGRKKDLGCMYHYHIFPHYVVIGEDHILDTDEIITGCSLTTDDMNIIFFDRQAFRILNKERSIIEQILKSRNSLEKVDVGDHSLVAYYTGKGEIFSTKTLIGNVSAHHIVSSDLSNNSGIHIDNEIIVNVEFSKEITFSNARSRIMMILFFIGLMMGRPQNITTFKIHTRLDTVLKYFLVYDNTLPEYQKPELESNRYHETVLVDASREPFKFSEILTAWVKRDETWKSARTRFFERWQAPRVFDISRLIRAANMFDLIPEKEFSIKIDLPEKFSSIVTEAKKTFKALPTCEERDIILNALAQVRRVTLKKKIRHRSEIITSVLENELPEIATVIDKAVDCRNYYVHGAKSSVDNSDEKYQQLLNYLTTTLEFVFATSDLINMGWDIEAWHKKKGMIISHPFRHYLLSYNENLSKFKAVFNR